MSGKQVITKYTEDQLKELLAKYDQQKLTNSEIAEKFGVNRSTISRWRRKFKMQLDVKMPISDQELVDKYNKEHSNIADLAKELGVSTDSIRVHLKAGGVKDPRKSDPKKTSKNVLMYHYTEDQLKAKLADYLQAGLTQAQIAKQLDSSPRTIGRWIKKFGLGKQKASSEITDEQLCEEYAKGHSANYIANKYHVSVDFVIRHLKAQGVFKGKVHGMKTARQKMHDDLWDHIKNDLDHNAYKQEIVNKYHISMPSLNKLMERHQYYPALDLNNLGDNDIDAIMDKLKISNGKRRAKIRHYLVSVQNFIKVCGYAPTVNDLARFTNEPYQEVYNGTRSLIFQQFMVSNSRLSYLVRKLCRILKQLNVHYELNNRRLISPYEIDVWVPEYNIGFEINPGSTHATTRINFKQSKAKLKRQVPSYYHQAKSLMAFQQGIRLVHVFDWTELSVSNVQNWLKFETFDFGQKVIDLDQLLITKQTLHKCGYYGNAIEQPEVHYINGNNRQTFELKYYERRSTSFVVYDAGKLILKKYRK